MIELRIIDVTPRPCANPQYPGKAFGSNTAAWWRPLYAGRRTCGAGQGVFGICRCGQKAWRCLQGELPGNAAAKVSFG